MLGKLYGGKYYVGIENGGRKYLKFSKNASPEYKTQKISHWQIKFGQILQQELVT